jgi:predicted transglutaminase-like cysteine proteinase
VTHCRPVHAPIRRSARLAAVALAAALAALAGQGARAAVSGGSIFGTSEVRADTVSLFPKWHGAVQRHFDESRLPDAPCESGFFTRCHLQEWVAFLDEIRGRDRLAQIEAVNGFMNRRRYIVDPRNYGVPDYWATPRQFLNRDGDCEDYAIAKYMSLRDLGVPLDDMRIVVLQDMNLRVAHAILVVWHRGRTLVLDNQIDRVVETAVVRQYRPIYSINERHWWLHKL